MENNLPVNVREYQELAKKALSKMHYDYINGGAEDEHTLRDNIAAYGRILLRPRVLVDVSNIDMSTSLLGYNMPSPIIVAPTGSHKVANPEGEVATAKAAASCNSLMVCYPSHPIAESRRLPPVVMRFVFISYMCLRRELFQQHWYGGRRAVDSRQLF
uniref:FMN hydroxy acid dehydrogenase domain-containing protein n=1 Tax=Aegilops tauschii subsp. strangulata TaxID=200361 RepID=A0A453L503_AEGTS